MKRIALFELSDTEKDDAKFWFETHKCNHPKPELYATEESTHISNVLLARCTCGKSEDITDYDKV